MPVRRKRQRYLDPLYGLCGGGYEGDGAFCHCYAWGGSVGDAYGTFVVYGKLNYAFGGVYGVDVVYYYRGGQTWHFKLEALYAEGAAAAVVERKAYV